MSLKYDEPTTGPDVETDVVGGKNVQVMKLAFGLSSENQRVDETAPLPVQTNPVGSQTWASFNYTGGFQDYTFPIPPGTQWVILWIDSASYNGFFALQVSLDGGSTWRGVDGYAGTVREITHNESYAFHQYSSGYAGGDLAPRLTAIGPLMPWVTHIRWSATTGGTGNANIRFAAFDKLFDFSELAFNGGVTPGTTNVPTYTGMAIMGLDGGLRATFARVHDKFDVGSGGGAGLDVSIVAAATGLPLANESTLSALNTKIPALVTGRQPVTLMLGTVAVDTGLIDVPSTAALVTTAADHFVDVIILANQTDEIQAFTLTDAANVPYRGAPLGPGEMRVLALYGAKFAGGVKIGATASAIKIQVKGSR